MRVTSVLNAMICKSNISSACSSNGSSATSGRSPRHGAGAFLRERDAALDLAQIREIVVDARAVARAQAALQR